MTWVRYDDQFPIHRKVAGLSDPLYRLHTEAIFWCTRNSTDGVIRRHELTQISARARTSRAGELVAAGLWHPAGTICSACADALAAAGTAEPADGWLVHDFLDFQPSRSKVAKERAAKADRQAKWLAAKKGPAGASRDTPRDTPRDASKDIAPRDANPAPPRPEGSGAGPRAPGRRPAAPDGRGGRDPENPDWRTLPPIGTPRDPDDVQRAQRGAAAARAQLNRKEAS